MKEKCLKLRAVSSLLNFWSGNIHLCIYFPFRYITQQELWIIFKYLHKIIPKWVFELNLLIWVVQMECHILCMVMIQLWLHYKFTICPLVFIHESWLYSFQCICSCKCHCNASVFFSNLKKWIKLPIYSMLWRLSKQIQVECLKGHIVHCKLWLDLCNSYQVVHLLFMVIIQV